jgi:DNA-binding beta-propeller fold protein YncE
MTDSRIYPNAGDESSSRPTVHRRALLASSAVAGMAVTAGCLGDDDGADPEESDTVFVFNTGDGTVSLVDVGADEVVRTAAVGLSSSFPSNQFSPRLTESAGDTLWLNVDQGVRAVSVDSFEEQARVETGSGANWQERTPEGDHLVVSAREPEHRQYRLDADPESDSFGEVMAEIDRASEGGRGDTDGPGPCDVTIHPDGEYAYVPDLFGDTLTVLGIDPFDIHRQVEVDSIDGVAPEPWMGTAAWDGETLLVEHNTGDVGAESIWDISDPGNPTERARLTPSDGLGEGPLTSEIGPDSAVGYVFTPGTEDVTLVDLTDGTVLDRLDIGGSAFTGTWGPSRETLYVPVRSADEVVVIDSDTRAITERLSVGADPYGATAATVRPSDDIDSLGSTENRVASLTDEYETTYCVGECACGHEL